MAQAAPGTGGTPRAAASLAVGLGLLFLCSFFVAPVTIEPAESMAAQVRRDTTAAQGGSFPSSPAAQSHAQGASSSAGGSTDQGEASRGLQEERGQWGKAEGGGKEGTEGREGGEGSGGGGRRTELATFAAGCFWSVELAFQRVPGVIKTTVGYTQGTTARPSYEDVSSGRTGHAEAVLVEYDPRQVSYERLLDAFWKKHDPTQKNGQGNDRGSQYRSGIFFHTPEQESAARLSLDQRQRSMHRKIVTEILPAKEFYPAEEYHQQYLEKGGRFGLRQSAEKGSMDPIRSYG